MLGLINPGGSRVNTISTRTYNFGLDWSVRTEARRVVGGFPFNGPSPRQMSASQRTHISEAVHDYVDVGKGGKKLPGK